jgi:hypothetical protein
VIDLLIDRRTLPKGITFKACGYEARPEIDIAMNLFVTEYRTEVLEDSQGHRFTTTLAEAACSVRKQYQGTLGLYVSSPVRAAGSRSRPLCLQNAPCACQRWVYLQL